eukprot:TRINITY_DN26794_c0_g1_i1.p1 TRINITY_DN26794_c0_g1~~TRINITY_DN26794_c0_g1_i1.p1  ORF type:complete len:577 (-),score=79.42 TRINITY_DN26794_c0_g1_i1:122-1852(-)
MVLLCEFKRWRCGVRCLAFGVCLSVLFLPMLWQLQASLACGSKHCALRLGDGIELRLTLQQDNNAAIPDSKRTSNSGNTGGNDANAAAPMHPKERVGPDVVSAVASGVAVESPVDASDGDGRGSVVVSPASVASQTLSQRVASYKANPKVGISDIDKGGTAELTVPSDIAAALPGAWENAEATLQKVSKRYVNIPAHCPQTLEGLYPAWTKAFKTKALERAVDGSVFITLANTKYAEVLSCWQWTVQEVSGRRNTMIIPMDANTVRVCKKHRLACVVPPTEADLPKIIVYGVIGFVKYYAMSLLAGLGLNFVLSEMDVQVYKNPWPYHEKQDDEQYRKGWCNKGARNPKKNPSTDEAVLQVSAHPDGPRVNIGYVYVRSTPDTVRFLTMLLGFFTGKCADKLMGWKHVVGTYVDGGLPDQNMFNAFLRNVDNQYAHYRDLDWKLVPQLPWKLLDSNVFGTVWGKTDHTMELVTNHFYGHGGQVNCWKSGVCRLFAEAHGRSAAEVFSNFECSMRVQRKCNFPHCNEPSAKHLACESARCLPPCVNRSRDLPLSLQGAVDEHCLPVPMQCGTGKLLR